MPTTHQKTASTPDILSKTIDITPEQLEIHDNHKTAGTTANESTPDYQKVKCSDFNFRLSLEFTDGSITSANQSISPIKLNGKYDLATQLKM